MTMTMTMTMITIMTMTRDEGNIPISNTATPADAWNRSNNEAGERGSWMFWKICIFGSNLKTLKV